MKKLLIFIVLTFAMSVCYAQQENKSLESKIDSLELKLNKIQSDHNLLSCRYNLDILNLRIQIFVNELRNDYYGLAQVGLDNRLSYDLYTSHKEKYESSMKLYEVYEMEFWYTGNLISLMIENSDFEEQALKALKSTAETIEQGLKTAKDMLDIQKRTLDAADKYLKSKY